MERSRMRFILDFPLPLADSTYSVSNKEDDEIGQITTRSVQQKYKGRSMANTTVLIDSKFSLFPNMSLIDFTTQLLQKCSSDPEKSILIVLKDTRPFHTDLRGLDLSNCISILLVNNYQGDKHPDSHTSHFDFVHYYETDHFYDNFEEKLTSLDKVEMPKLDQIIDHLIDALKNNDPHFDAGRIRLAVAQELFLRLAAKIRQRHGIPGPRPEEVQRFTDKAVMKQVARDGHLDTAKYIIVTPGQLVADEAKMESLLAIGFPIIAKPLNGSGGAGITKIENQNQLNTWLLSQEDPNMEYMVEEFIEGDEFRFLALVQPQSVQFFPVTLVIRGHSFVEGLATGRPASLVVLQDPKKCSIIDQLALDVIRVFQPSPGTIVYIQGFVTKDGTAKLNELTSRAPGGISSTTFTQNTNISPESVQIMAQVRKLDLQEMAAQKADKKLCAFVLYPEVEGTVKELLPLASDKVESEVKVIHAVKVGEKTDAAANICDLAAKVLVWNEDGQLLESDVDWLKENYKPVVVE